MLKTPGMAVGLKFAGDSWTFRREECPRLPAMEGYQLQLTVRSVDLEGNPCFRESAKVRFWTEGPIRLLAVDNGDIPYVDVYRQGQINTCIKGMRMEYSYDTADCLTGGNGTHLNATGYKKWYLPMLETAMGAYL